MQLMDVSLNGTLNEEYSRSKLHYFIKKRNMVLLSKLNDDDFPGQTDVWRLIVSSKEKDADLSTSWFQAKVDAVLPGVRVGTPEWVTSFLLQKRMVTSYRSTAGRVLLAGDSAHIHSPAGGQGMNVCIQDAFNLGWKLAMVCNGLAGEKLLETYETERVPIGAKVLEGTDLVHKVILSHGMDLQERIKMANAGQWVERAVMTISGEAYKYCQDDAAEQLGSETVVRAGVHAPDLLVERTDGTPVRLTALRAPYYVLVELDDDAPSVKSAAEEQYGAWLQVVRAAPVGGASKVAKQGKAPSRPSDSLLRGQYGPAKGALVRADGYIDRLFGAEDTPTTILEYLSALGVAKVD